MDGALSFDRKLGTIIKVILTDAERAMFSLVVFKIDPVIDITIVNCIDCTQIKTYGILLPLQQIRWQY